MRRTPPPRGPRDRRPQSQGRTDRGWPKAIDRGVRPLDVARGCAARTHPRRTAREARRRQSRQRPAGFACPGSAPHRASDRDEIAGEEVFDLVRSRRPLVSDQPQSLRLGEILGLPVVEQIVDYREEAFLGWIPRLREVVIEMRHVDGLDGGVDVRVGREHHASRQRIHVARLRERVGPLDARHPLVADHDGQRVASRLDFADGGERLFARGRADDRVGLTVPRAEIAAHRREHLRIVVNDKKYGLVHRDPPAPSISASGRETRNSVRPGAVSTSISASLWLTRRRTISRPRPVPFPTGLVVKNGSNRRSRISGGMPAPLSTTRTTTRCRSRFAVTSTRPESGTASSALSIRFAQIWLSSPPKPRTRGWPGSTVTSTATDFARALDLSTVTVLPRLNVRSTGSATVAWSMCVNPLMAMTRPEIRFAASWISEAIPRTEHPAAAHRRAAPSGGPLTATAIRSRASSVVAVSASGPAMSAS